MGTCLYITRDKRDLVSDDDSDDDMDGNTQKKLNGNGRRKIPIQFIEEKSKRHITVSVIEDSCSVHLRKRAKDTLL
jgi:hypothetical protein